MQVSKGQSKDYQVIGYKLRYAVKVYMVIIRGLPSKLYHIGNLLLKSSMIKFFYLLYN